MVDSSNDEPMKSASAAMIATRAKKTQILNPGTLYLLANFLISNSSSALSFYFELGYRELHLFFGGFIISKANLFLPPLLS